MTSATNSPPSSGEPFAHLLRYGLSRALQAHSDQLRSRHARLALDLDLVDDEGLLEWGGAHALYAVYILVMDNILRKANDEATAVRVHYAPQGSDMCLEIRADAGAFSVGDDWSRFQRGGQSVMGLKTQIDGMGGFLRIAAEEGQEARIAASLPMLPSGAVRE